MLPSRCAVKRKASPTGPKPSQQVRSEPACIPVTGCMEPGVASVQAAAWSPEICTLWSIGYRPCPRGRNADALYTAEGSSPFLRYGERGRTPPGSEIGACTHRGSSGTWESLRLPCYTQPEQGLPAYQRVLALSVRFPTVSEPEEGIQTKGKRAGYRERAVSEAARDEP
jgi:hypothetical protein